jgi:predicted ribosomally synthesized peptide with nif11-like leader
LQVFAVSSQGFWYFQNPFHTNVHDAASQHHQYPEEQGVSASARTLQLLPKDFGIFKILFTLILLKSWEDTIMSIKSARLFVQKMYTNREFANQVMKIEDDTEFNEFVAKEGYDFGAHELKEADHEFRNKVNGELSETELSMVVGGVSIMFPPCTSTAMYSYCQQTQ